MRKISSLILLFLVVMSARAGVPDGYYQKADCKSGAALKDALQSIIIEHTTLRYSDLWEYYPYTYYVINNPSQVLDLYSDNKVYFSNSSSMNKEHTVPQSWWGKGTGSGPGCDIYNVIPSDSKANSAKSNYPLGVVKGSPSFDNGVTKVGDSGVEGYSGKVFEPKDDYKGDFARIYFYVATCYPDLAWDNNNAAAMTNSSSKTLQSWIIPLLLEWNALDPVDAGEIQRNEDVYKYQGNRNPFIDYPSLIEYIWGGSTNLEYVFSEHAANEGDTQEQKTIVPSFNVNYGTADNPKNVLEGTVVTVKGGTSLSTLYTRVNGGEWTQTDYTVGWNAATESEYHTPAEYKVTISGNTCIEAYCTREGFKQSDVVTAYYCGVDFNEDFLLHEEFDVVTSGNNTSTSGSSARWEGNENFPTVDNVFCAGNAVKLGSGKAVGCLTSRSLNTLGGTVKVEFDVKGWTTVEGNIEVGLTGADSQTASYSAVLDGDFEHISLTFTGVSANPVLTIATTAKRCFIDNVSVTEVGNSAITQPSATMSSTRFYNIQGQRVDANYRGIIIVNGRKYLKK